MNYQTQIQMFRALSDETRLRLLEELRDGEVCACVLLAKCQLRDRALRYQMKILQQVGLVNSRKDGKWTYYYRNPQGTKELRELMHYLFRMKQEAVPVSA